MRRPPSWGGRGVLPKRRSLPKEQNSCNTLPHYPGQWAMQLLQYTATLPWGQWAVELLQCTVSLPGGMGSATPAIHCLTAWGQWAVQLLQCTATLPRGLGSATPAIHCLTAWGSGQWISCNTLPHSLGAVGSGAPAMRGPTSCGDGESCLGGGRCLKSRTRAMHCHTAWGQWAVELLLCTASVPGGSGQWNSCHALPHCLGEWAVELVQCTASVPGAVGSGTCAMYCLGAWGQWAVELLSCTVSLPGGSGQCNSCNTLPHRLGAVNSGTPAMRRPPSWGGRGVLPGGGRCL